MSGFAAQREEITSVLEHAKEKLGEPIDYVGLVLEQLRKALSLRSGSVGRQLELNDLEDLLSPFIGEEFEEDMKKLEADEPNWTKRQWNAAYHRGRLKLIMKLMKANDILTIGTI